MKNFMAIMEGQFSAGQALFASMNDATVDDVRMLKQLLEENATRLEPAYARRLPVPPRWNVSAISPITADSGYSLAGSSSRVSCWTDIVD